MSEMNKAIDPFKVPLQDAARAMGNASSSLDRLTSDPSCGPAMKMALDQVKRDLQQASHNAWALLNAR